MAERGTAALDALRTELETMAVPYSVDRFLSSGSYGVVCAGTDKLTGLPVAVKRVHTTRSENRVLNILGDPFLARRVIREVRLLGHFHHPNILGLKDLMVTFGRGGSSAGDHRLYLVTELMKTDLGQVIHDPKMELTREYVQYYMYHVLLGLHTLHRAGVVHRDLHPGNILLSKDNDVKICDFNLAREDSTSDEKTYYVTHRWYRAPELVMQYRGFSKGVDIWSAGCVMAELYTRKALFRGTTFYNQLNKIIEIIGTPKAEDYESFASQSAAEYLRNSLGAIPSRSWKSVIPAADDVALDLLTRMLQFNPAKRISVEEALAHPFFEDHFDPADLQLYQSPTFHFDDGGDNQISTLHRILQEDVDIWAHRRRERLAAVAAAAGKTAPPQDPDAAASPVASQFVSNGHFPRTGSSVSFD